MKLETLLLTLTLCLVTGGAVSAAEKKPAPAPVLSSPALVSWETPSRTGQERRGEALISWERTQPVVPQQAKPLPPLVLPRSPNFVLTTSAPLRQYDVEEESVPPVIQAPPQAREK
ncbi:MAG TPA: hypothetical protein VL404_01735 [Candidatus Eisenbacteria bacterium]|jgi:hypothetical protein|nr:hypothetical protein [Candidatus Eisenbacteria bacterium]